MKHESIIGQTIDLEGRKVLVKSVDKKIDSIYGDTYTINGCGNYSHFDMALIVSAVRQRIEQANLKHDLISRLKRQFGLFISYFKDLGDEYQKPRIYFGVREYGYTKCAVYFGFDILGYSFRIEASWKEKDAYLKGILPERLRSYRQLF